MSLALEKIEIAAPIGNIDTYMQIINRIPIFSAEEEKAYAIRYQEKNDLDAARQLVLSQLRYVVHIAKGYMGYGLALADLIQEGNIGLMKAVKRFNPLLGVRLISFAVHWIKAEIHEFIIKNWRIVKIATTKAQRKLFFHLRSAKKKLGWFNQKEVKQIATDLGVKTKLVQEMEARLSSYDASLETPFDEEAEESFTPHDYLADTQSDPAQKIEDNQTLNSQEKNLQLALTTLDKRSYDIVSRRWLAEEKATLTELANEYQISAERVRQLEQSAMKKLRHVMTSVT
ncbi:MAG: RNA polymerase sigma factor RpoH [Legionellaceae bacterium]